ncbi:hypothetical protein BJF79_19340 [Actinomadura sp. CNU-125]|nr:hypothetical protein BJF79_19340 [Actinomadura sp. CNU-125]
MRRAIVPPRRRRATTVRHLERLEPALTCKGWHCLRSGDEPLMRVYVGSGVREVGALVTVRDGWYCLRSSTGLRVQWVAPCGDVGTAGDRIDDLLRPRLFPGTFAPYPPCSIRPSGVP